MVNLEICPQKITELQRILWEERQKKEIKKEKERKRDRERKKERKKLISYRK